MVLNVWTETKLNLDRKLSWFSLTCLNFAFPWQIVASRFSLVSYQQIFLCFNILKPKPTKTFNFVWYINMYLHVYKDNTSYIHTFQSDYSARLWLLLLHMQCHRAFFPRLNPFCVLTVGPALMYWSESCIWNVMYAQASYLSVRQGIRR